MGRLPWGEKEKRHLNRDMIYYIYYQTYISYYKLQCHRTPRNFCLYELYLLIFTVLEIKTQRFKKDF